MSAAAYQGYRLSPFLSSLPIAYSSTVSQQVFSSLPAAITGTRGAPQGMASNMEAAHNDAAEAEHNIKLQRIGGKLLALWTALTTNCTLDVLP